MFEGLPAEAKRNKVPMIFHGVIGQDLKEESSPSFFNPEEVTITVDYVKNLLQMRTNRVSKSTFIFILFLKSFIPSPSNSKLCLCFISFYLQLV